MPDNQPDVQPQDAQSTQDQIPSPEQTQAQPAPSLFQSAMAPVVQQAQPAAQLSQDQAITQAKAQRDKQLEFHPAVNAAHVVRKVAQALAGGQQYKETIADDGSVTREPIPMSSKDLLRYSVANILGGLSNMGRAYTASHEHLPQPAAQPLPSQVAQQQRNQESEQDFDRRQTALVQKSKVISSNLEAMRAAYSIGKEDDSVKDAVIANHRDDLDQWNKAGAVEASNIPSSQLMSKGFDKSRYIAVPDGKIPAIGPDGKQATNAQGVPLSELTYAIVDGTTQTPLAQAAYDKFSKFGLVKGKEDFSLPEGATITGASLALMNHRVDLYNQTQNELDQVAGPGKVNLASEIKNNKSVAEAVHLFHNDAASTDPVTQINNMKASQDPKVRAAAGTMVNLFGQPALDAYAAKNQTADDLTADKAQSIVSDPKTDKTSPAYQKAVNFLNNARTQKAQTAADEAKAKQGAESNSGDVQEAARNILGGDLTQLKDITSMRGGQRTAMFNAIHDEAVRQNKNPNDFSPAALKTKSDMYEDYRQGKTSNNIAAFDAFLGHANDAMDANDAWRRSGSPLINKSMSWLAKNATNDQNYIAFDTSLEPVRKEFMSFLNANRAEHAEDLKTMETVLNSNNSPAQVETALKQLGKSADIRLAAIGRKYENTIGTPFPNLVSNEGKQTLSRMGILSKSAGQASQGQASPQNGQPNAHPFFSKFGGKADQQ